MKKLFKKAALLIAAITLIISAAAIPSSAASTVISFNPQKPTVGQNVTITVTVNADFKMYGADFSVSYNQSVLEYKSADCAANGGGGVVKAAPAHSGETKGTYKFTFTAKTAGSSPINVSGGAYGDSEYNIGASATLTVSDAAKPGVATLKSLSLSEGTLSPAFSSGRTSYTAKVKYEVTSCKVFATATDGNRCRRRQGGACGR